MIKKRAGIGVLSGLCGASALLVAAVATADPPGPPTVSVVVNFNPALGQLPESMTADNDGHLFASNFSGAIQQIDPVTQTFTTIATVPVADFGGVLTGIKVGPDGLIYVCSASFSSTPDGAFIWRVSRETGAVEKFASLDANGFPNDLVFQDDGTLLVTDPFLGLIWSIDTAGTPSVFLADPLFLGDPVNPAFAVHAFGIDGIAFDANKRNLIVSTLDFGRVMNVALDVKGGPTITIIAEDPSLKGVDGIAIDRRGIIFCAVNTQDRLATVDKQGNISVITQGPPLDSPSSFAFGTGHGDKRTLYVANFAISNFLAGQPAHPGILSLPTQVPGLTLP
jgi:sugar lactone lactonase YvrE